MLVTIQIPIVDLRPILPFETYRLHSPTWPIAEENKEFIRSFGSIKKRRRKGIDSWPGEHLFCDARHAIKLKGNPAVRLTEFHLNSLAEHLKLKDMDDLQSWIKKMRSRSQLARCRYRRVTSDGRVVARFEIGFQFHPYKPGYWFKRNGKEHLAACAELPVTFPREPQRTTPMLLAGRQIAWEYLKATTSRRGISQIQSWWVTAGHPLMVTEGKETLEFPARTSYFNLTRPYLDVAYWQYAGSEQTVPVWTIFGEEDAARQFRMHISRLHAERECLKHVLRSVSRGQIEVQRGTEASEVLQAYLLNAIRILSRKTKFGMPQSALLKMVEDCEDLIDYGERVSLLQKLADIRRNVLRQVETYTKSRTHVGRTILNIKNSNIGILNTGELGKMESVVVTLASEQGSSASLDKALREVESAVSSSSELAIEMQQDLFHLLSEIKQQASLPCEKRASKEAIKNIVLAITSITGTAGGVAQVWSVWGKAITAFFGL